MYRLQSYKIAYTFMYVSQGTPAARLLLRDWLSILANNYHAAKHPDAAGAGPQALLQLPVGPCYYLFSKVFSMYIY